MSGKYRPLPYPVRTTPLPIRYFELTDAMFAEQIRQSDGTVKRAFHTDFEKVTLRSAYLDSSTDLARLDPVQSDTCILNFQVGTGKTQVLFDYIEKYLAAGTDFTIFYCAPFLRLLKEITRELRKRGVTYFDCTRIDSLREEDAFATTENFDYQVQLMTPDFLVGSGGKKSVRQAAGKSGYKEKLREHLKGKARKVVLIIDEIHEKPAAFASQHLPELLVWSELVHKVFIASATFTADAVEASKAVSFLTNRRLAVFQADRVKGAKQARLHLHICTQEYSEKDLHPLAGLVEVIDQYPGKPIHILTAYKSIAQKLAAGRDSDAAKAVHELVPRAVLLTADNKTAFDASKSSVGTTFKTGVNIRSEEGVLIAILPGQNTDPGSSPYLGTFTDIRSSIVQAFARLRNGGDLHVFMPPFDSHIRSSDFVTRAWCDVLLEKAGVRPKDAGNYLEEALVLADFDKLYAQREEMLAVFKRTTDPDTSAAYDKLIKFEGRYDFLLSEFPAFKDTFLEKQNQGLPALILWMGVHEQFTNCSLATVTVEQYATSAVKKAVGESWLGVFSKSIRSRLPAHKPTTLFRAFETVEQLLDKNEAEPGRAPLYGVKRVGSSELFRTTKAASEAALTLACRLLSSDGSVPQKKDWFTLLVQDAKPWDGSPPTEEEDFYSFIQSALRNLAKQVITAATSLKGSQYLPQHFEQHLSEETTQLLTILAEALAAATASSTLLNLGTVYLPGYSSTKPQNQEDYLQAALALLRNTLGLDLHRVPRQGRKDLFGAEMPHLLITLPAWL